MVGKTKDLKAAGSPLASTREALIQPPPSPPVLFKQIWKTPVPLNPEVLRELSICSQWPRHPCLAKNLQEHSPPNSTVDEKNFQPVDNFYKSLCAREQDLKCSECAGW